MPHPFLSDAWFDAFDEIRDEAPEPPAAAADLDNNTTALRLAGHTTKGKAESLEETIRVLATRVGMTGPVGLPDLMNRLRERGDRDLLSLMV